MTSRTRLLVLFAGFAVAFVCAGTDGRTQDNPAPSPDEHSSVGASLEKDVLRAVRASLQWFEQQQSEDGHWSNPQFPAMTALVVWAHLRNPDAISVDDRGWQRVEVYPYVQKGIDYILSCVQSDGGIYLPLEGVKGGGLASYNTAICMAALTATGDARYEDVIRNARRFVFGTQYLGGGEFDGGMGYDAATERAYADMSNSYIAIEAIRYTEFIRYVDQVGCLPPSEKDLINRLNELKEESEETGQEQDTLNWDRAIQFLSRCQNLPETNKNPWVSPDEDDRGGFVYYPGNSKAEERLLDGASYPRSYGSITHAGLLSFLYAELDRNDERVLAAYDWITRHFTVDENPGLGQQSLYYYYLTMARALTAYGEDILTLADSETVDWRTRLMGKIISLQRIDPKTSFGYWVNDNGRWWENDPILTTSYATLALEICLQGTAP